MLVDTVIILAFTNIDQMILADGHEFRTLSRISFG